MSVDARVRSIDLEPRNRPDCDQYANMDRYLARIISGDSKIQFWQAIERE